MSVFRNAFQDCLEDETKANEKSEKLNGPVKKKSNHIEDTKPWLEHNFGADANCKVPEGWLTTFLITCWKIWNWRNKINQGEEVPPLEVKLEHIRRLTQDVEEMALRKGLRGKFGVSQLNIAWQFPDEGWIKINTDGAARGNPGLAACGGG
ncbi:hypothetical protein K1719_005540 [Acacia pycnantha]|nr:hypothetical protein K1719_005540 [Acacia pycnantha]